MSQSKLLLKLEYGNPAISELSLADGRMVLEIITPAVTEKSMIVVSDPQKIMVEHEVDDRFVEKFKFFLCTKNDDVFKNVSAYKDNGMFFLSADVEVASNNEPKTISV